jgi:signal peptidase I
VRRIVIALGGVAAALAVLLSRRLTAYVVAERSMEPALHPGDWVLALRDPACLRRGDVVAFEHRPGFELVKRVTALPGDRRPDGLGVLPPGHIWVTGDNPEAGSVDSARLGPIPRGRVRARILLRYRPLPPSPIARR